MEGITAPQSEHSDASCEDVNACSEFKRDHMSLEGHDDLARLDHKKQRHFEDARDVNRESVLTVCEEEGSPAFAVPAGISQELSLTPISHESSRHTFFSFSIDGMISPR